MPCGCGIEAKAEGRCLVLLSCTTPDLGTTDGQDARLPHSCLFAVNRCGNRLIPQAAANAILSTDLLRKPSEQESRDPWELFEIGLSFLDEGILTFLGFLTHVIEQGGIASQVQQPHLPIAIGVEG